MRSHLTLLIADPGDDHDATMFNAITVWGSAGIIDEVGLIDRHSEEGEQPPVTYLEQGAARSIPLYDVLTSRLWTAVTVVSCRPSVTTVRDDESAVFEEQLLDTISSAFAANHDLVLRAVTVSVADTHGSVAGMRFSPRYDLHLAHEPSILADHRLAAVPITRATSPLVVALTALLAAGGFVWQNEPLIGELKDTPEGNLLPVRVVRAGLRVVTGGRLADDIIAGAFPESGPWSVPPEAGQCRSVPIGTMPPTTLADQVATAAGFVFQLAPPARTKRPEEVGLWTGVKLFFGAFMQVLSRTPGMIIDRGKTWLGSKTERMLQDLTFGPNSALVIKYQPGPPDDDFEVLAALQRAGVPQSAFPLADPAPWELLYLTSFGLVDGGDLPSPIEAPREGARRLIYLDPAGIGSSPADPPFHIPAIDMALLGLPEQFNDVEPVDVATARSVDELFTRFRTGTGSPDTAPPTPTRRTARNDKATPPTADDTDTPERQRPSHPLFNVGEYRPLTSFYQGNRPELLAHFTEQNKAWSDARANHQAIDGPFTRDSRCDHCGTGFLVGVVFEHVPSGRLIHVGHICASKTYPATDDLTAERAQLEQLELQWREWKAPQQQSLLWRVGEHIEQAIVTARRELGTSVSAAAEPDPDVLTGETAVRRKIRRRMVYATVMLVAAIVAGVLLAFVFAVVSVVYCAIGLGVILTGWILRFAVLTRDLARAQFRLLEKDSQRVQAMQRASHDAQELARLLTARRQFDDWQVVIREIVHAPFGRAVPPALGELDITEVERPQSFLLANAAPSRDQLADAQLKAKAVTIHKGWLRDIYLTSREKWSEQYRRVRLADDADDLSPENDNADGDAVVTVVNGQQVYYSRSDFRRHLQSGDLRAAVIGDRVDAIITALGDQPLDELLSAVRIEGPGAALGGCSPETLLQGLAERPVPAFASDLFGLDHLELRIDNVDFSLQGPDGPMGHVSLDSLGPGKVFTAASWRMDFSPPLLPRRLGEPEPNTTIPGDGDPAVSVV